MHTQRIMAIFEKDLKDFMKNMMLLMMPVIPLSLAILWGQMGVIEEFPTLFVYLLVGVTFAGVSSTCMMTMMAEENEKKTLRGLMLSPATFADIIIGKSMVTTVMTALSLTLSLVIVGFNPFSGIRETLGIILLFLFFLLLGISIGIFAKSIASTSAYILPILFLFAFTPMVHILGLDEGSIVIIIADAFPLLQVMEIADTSSWLPLQVILAWVAGAAALAFLSFKKNVTDD